MARQRVGQGPKQDARRRQRIGRGVKPRGLSASTTRSSRHQRWYRRHHEESKARSALRVWALRNSVRELTDGAIALGSICLPKDFMAVLDGGAQAGHAHREKRALLLRKLESSLVAGSAVEVKDRAERLAAEVMEGPPDDADDLVDLGRAFDLIRDTGTFVREARELRGAFERQAAISRSLDAYWYRMWQLDRRRFAPYLVKSFLHHANLWRIYGFLTDGAVEYRRAEQLTRHALQAIGAAGVRSGHDATLEFCRFDALLCHSRIRGVHEQIYDSDTLRCVAHMGEIARAWPRRDIVGAWTRELSCHAVGAAGDDNYGDPVERALEAEALFAPELATIPPLRASILRTKIEALVSSRKTLGLEADLSVAVSLVSEHRDTVWAQLLKRAVWRVCRRFGKPLFSPDPDPFRLSSTLLELYAELLRPLFHSPQPPSRGVANEAFVTVSRATRRTVP